MNKSFYVIYGLYLCALIIFFRNVLFFPNPELLLKAVALLSVPIIVSFLISIYIKSLFFKRVQKVSKRQSFFLALKASSLSFWVMLLYVLMLMAIASVLRMVTPGAEALVLFGVSQDSWTIVLEVFALLALCAWISRSLEYHAIWNYLKDDQRHIVRRGLLYINVVSYLKQTVLLTLWIMMTLYQWPQWFWNIV